ncbi:divalent metal cation transporter [Staphylococcus aureus]
MDLYHIVKSLQITATVYIALGIIGATIMPHNLYLHSSIVQSRTYSRHNNEEKAQAIKFATIDSNIQLSIAFVIELLIISVRSITIFQLER